MRWEDEQYVKVYVRDTVEWQMLRWESRALWPLILRKVDRAGLLDLGKHGARGLAVMLGMPIEVVEPGLAELVADGCAVMNGTVLIIPNFIPAQETPASDKLRAKEYRERKRQQALETAMSSRNVTFASQNVTTESQNVTDRHAVVTDRHALLSDLILAKREREDSGLPPGLDLEPSLPKKRAKKKPEALTEKHQAAIPLLAELSAAKQRVDPSFRGYRPTRSNLDLIADRLAEGNTPEDVRHVIAIGEAESKVNAESRKYFDAITPFRPKNFPRYLGKTIRGSAPQNPDESRPPTAAERIAAREAQERGQ